MHIDHDRGLYYPMGDNNKHGDNPITKDEILGKLVFSCPRRTFNDLFGGLIFGSIIGLIVITQKIIRGDKPWQVEEKKNI